MTSSTRDWAVLVGIDQYSDDPLRNLVGSANDAVKLHHFLTRDLNFPKSQIKLHLARQPRGRSSVFSHSDPKSTPPTRQNFLESLRWVERNSRHGDFLLIHFSGHGDRVSTSYKDLKSGTGQDELLWFLDEPITDVDLGNRLDELSGNGLVILVTLDCCFSGGATKFGQKFRIRCMPKDKMLAENSYEPQQQPRPQEGNEASRTGSWNTRNARISRGWLYRKRRYNVMAACQEHEWALEQASPDGKYGGLLTTCLVDCYRNLRASKETITYATIQDALEASIKQKSWNSNKQQPMMIGDPRRVLFGSHISNSRSAVTAYVLGIVTSQAHSTLLLDKGASCGVEENDVYYIQEPISTEVPSSRSKRNRATQKQAGRFELIITSVGDFTSEAMFNSDKGTAPMITPALDKIGMGCMAILKRRSRSTLVRVIYHSYASRITDIQKNWTSYVDPAMQVDLVFSRDRPGPVVREAARLNAVFRDGQVIIEGAEEGELDHLPALSSSDKNLTKRLMRRLTHLCAFLTVKDIKTRSCASPLLNPGHVTLDQTSPGFYELIINNPGPKTVFVTVFNLTPLYGCSQCFPPPDEGKAAIIEPGKSRKVPAEMEIPPDLANGPWNGPYNMEDILKVFISSEQVDLTCFRLSHIIEAERGKLRDFKTFTTPVAPWQVEQREITTRVLMPPTHTYHPFA